jgi:hypothetical protein
VLTIWRRVGTYTAHPAEQPLSLQDHSQPVRFRNIWIRKLNLSNEQERSGTLSVGVHSPQSGDEHLVPLLK